MNIATVDPVEVGMSAEGITRLCDAGLKRAEELASQLRLLKDAPDEALTRDATLGLFDELNFALLVAIDFSALLALVHPDAAVRKAAKACEPKVDNFETQLYLDPDIASVFKRFSSLNVTLAAGDVKMLTYVLRDYRRNGLNLDEVGQRRLKLINESLTKLGQDFSVNLAESNLSLEVTPEQLDGLPKNFMDSHPQNEHGKIRITTDYSDYFAFMRYAHDRQAARELFILWNTRAREKNLPILDQLLALRKEKATLLGYPNWAEFMLEPMMAKTSDQVRLFLDDLHRHLSKKVAAEMEPIRAVFVEKGGGLDEPIPASDALYLSDLAQQKTYHLDSQKLSEYFEINNVIKGLLEISSRLFRLVFKDVNFPVWHQDVRVIEVFRAGKKQGRIYFDLYPRPDKYKHAAVFTIQGSRKMADGTRVMPAVALVCNFPKSGITPSLLSHDEVVTLFHEFGHALHGVLNESELAYFSGTRVVRDFVEVPSQLLEEWAWKREALDLFGRHYQTGENIPDELLTALINSEKFALAIDTERQLMLADLDQICHTRDPGLDIDAVIAELHAKYRPFASIPGTSFQSTFGHFVGYDARYYGYQWALSIAKDLFTRFENEGLFNQATATQYLETILQPGGTLEEAEMVATFLGRPWSPEAYKKYLA